MQRSTDRLKSAVRRYMRAGYAPIPVPNGTKAPNLRQWPKLRLCEQQIDDYFGDTGNVGLLLGKPSGGLVDVDVDAPEAAIAAAIFLPATGMLHGRQGKPRSHWFYAMSQPPAPMKFIGVDGSCLVELRSTGQQTIVPPSIHPSGEPFLWESEGAPAKVKAEDLVRAVKLVAASSLLARHWPELGSRHDASLALSGMLLRGGWSVEDTENFLKATARAARDEEWQIRATDADSTAQRLFENGDATGAPRLAELVGDAVVARLREWLELPREGGQVCEREHLTDLGNARRFVAQHGNEIRYCHLWKKWLVWDGTRWAVDETGEVERKAKDTVRKIYGEASRENNAERRKTLAAWARMSESRGRIVAMIELGKSEPAIPVLPAELDSDMWQLNCANGTIDLRTGQLQKHSPENLCTKLVPVAYDPDAKCPQYKEFLNRIFNGNRELMLFLQRAIGYCLTGSTREQSIFIFYGHGANGKSTLIEVLRACLGDYAKTADSSLLMARKYEGVRNDVARLAGARFVSTAETEAGRQLAEVLVKQLTGGDKITARYLYSEFFEYDAQFKLFLATNHKPVIRGTDHAMWRRIKLVPFEVTIPEDEQDKDLAEKLRGELPGILAWAVRGCRRWQKNGLGQPEEVCEATAAYRQEMDVLGGFIKDCCIVKKEGKEPAGQLYAVYKMWCEKNGEQQLGHQKFAMALTDRGFRPYRTGRVRSWVGLELRDASDTGVARFG